MAFQPDAYQNSAFQTTIILPLPPDEEELDEMPFITTNPNSVIDRMHFRALDSNFNATAIIDAYDSLIWTERHGEEGDFEISGPNNPQLLDILHNSTYIFNNVTSKVMVIEKTSIEYDSEIGNTVTISGRSFERFLDRRVFLKPITIFNPADRRISQIICDQVLSAFGNSIADRHWDKLQVVNRTSESAEQLAIGTSLQFSAGTNLYSAIMELCAAYKLGFKCELSALTGMTVFSVYQGLDLSEPGENLVLFSDLNDNLISSKEEIESGHLKSTVLVTGNYVDELTYAPKLTQTVSLGTPTGLARREAVLNTMQEKIIYNDDGSTAIMDDATYVATLQQAGLDALNSNSNKVYRRYNGEILETVYKYGTDFNLGDIVGIRLPHGQQTKARLDAITFADDAKEGKTLAPSFNYDV